MNYFSVYRWSDVPRLVALATVYALLAKTVLTFFFVNQLVSIFWPPSGIALSALLLGGNKYWPGVFIGAFTGNFLAGGASEIAFVIAVGNTLEALTGSLLLAHFGHFNTDLTHARDYFWLALIAAICALVSTMIGNCALALSTTFDKQSYLTNLFKWWQGDVLGIVLVTPMVLVWRQLPSGWFDRHRILETLAFSGLAFLFGQVIFLGWFSHTIGMIARGYWMFLFIVWGALRFGRHGTLLIIGMIAIQSIMGAALKTGFFGSDLIETQLNNFWYYMLVLTLVGITLCLTIYERGKAQARVLRLTKLYQALSETNQAIVRMDKEAELCPLVCRCAVDYGGMKMAWIGQLDESQELIVPVSAYGSDIEYLDGLTFYTSGSFPEGRGPTGTALRENHPVIIQDYLNDPMTRLWHERAVKMGWGSAASFPIQRDKKPFAVLNVYHGLSGIFDEETVNLLKEMANDVSFALDNFDRENHRKIAEKQLYESESHLRLVTESAQALIWMADTEKQCTWFNKIWLDFTGRTLEQEKGNGWTEGVYPDDLQRCIDYFHCHFERREPFSMEYRLKRHDGEYCWILDNGSPYFDGQGNFQGYIGACLDITERKIAESALRESESRFRQVTESLPQLIWTCGPDGSCDYLSSQWCQYTGLPEAPQLGNGWLEQIHPEDRDRVITGWGVTAPQGQHYEIEYRLRRHDGVYRWFYGLAVPLCDESGAIVKWFGSSTDIEEQKNHEAQLKRYQDDLEQRVVERTHELEEARQDALRLSQVKSVFLANISHEIRSPMNAMLGFLYLLEQKPLDAEAMDLVRKVRNGGKSLLSIINDILDYSKIEAGQLEIQRAPFRLSDVLDQIAALMSAFSVEKNLELIIDVCPALADYLIGDALKLQQVLVNLTSNAIKFTQQGEVKLMIKVVAPVAGNSVKIRFSVKDTGIGIDPAKQQDIFSPFAQADSTISRRFGGTGLGLAISRQLVDLMGGSLHVDSEAGKGSTFWFELVFELDFNRKPDLLDMKHLDVLIVDDCDATLAALANAIKFLGWQAETALSGQAACARVLARLSKNKPFDVILVDWQMPGMDGLSVVSEIKKMYQAERDKSIKPPLLIMVSAFSRDQLLSQTDIDNADLVLTKPVTPSTFYDAILALMSKHIKKPDPDASVSGEPKKIQLAGLNILVVDDSDINREIASTILSLYGAHVTTFENGHDIIDWLKTHPHEADIILMDVQMPEIDGYETTRLIRQIPHLAHIPIAALTAGAFRDDQDNARAAGMDDFIPKPFDVDQLISVILSLVKSAPENKARIDNGNNVDRPDMSEIKPVAGGKGKTHTSGVIDIQAGISLFGSMDPYVECLPMFVKNYAKAGHEIADLISSGDIGNAAALVHKLKGSAGYFGLKNILKCVNELEARLATGSPIENLPDQLKSAIEEAIHEINILTGNSMAPPHFVSLKDNN